MPQPILITLEVAEWVGAHGLALLRCVSVSQRKNKGPEAGPPQLSGTEPSALSEAEVK